MKTFLALIGAVLVGYLVFAEWVDQHDDIELDDAPRFAAGDDEFLAHLPHPWSRVS